MVLVAANWEVAVDVHVDVDVGVFGIESADVYVYVYATAALLGHEDVYAVVCYCSSQTTLSVSSQVVDRNLGLVGVAVKSSVSWVSGSP